MSAWVSTSSRLAMAAVSLVGVVAGKTSGPNYYTAEQLSRAAALPDGRRHAGPCRRCVSVWPTPWPCPLPSCGASCRQPPSYGRPSLARPGGLPGCGLRQGDLQGRRRLSVADHCDCTSDLPELPRRLSVDDFTRFYENGMRGQCDLSGDYPDDGSGWSASGLRHYFVGHWCQTALAGHPTAHRRPWRALPSDRGALRPHLCAAAAAI